ncbi:MAG: hypothetical protein ACK5XF_00105, partial [Neisseriaceae bacterium]
GDYPNLSFDLGHNLKTTSQPLQKHNIFIYINMLLYHIFALNVQRFQIINNNDKIKLVNQFLENVNEKIEQTYQHRDTIINKKRH